MTWHAHAQLLSASMASERVADLKAKANAAVTKSDFSTAVAHLTEALLEMQPGAKELWSNRAFALSAMGKHKEALVDAQRCIDMAPTFSKGYLRAGRALIALGRHSDATNLLEDAFEKMPQDYALKEALEEAISAAASGSSTAQAAAGGSAWRPRSPAASSASGGALDSSYYYAAVPASQRVLPVAAPVRIDAVSPGSTESSSAAAGHIRDDIECKGAPLQRLVIAHA